MTSAAQPAKVRTAVLISGSGSNLQALMDAADAPDFPAEISLVISNKADAYGLERAQKKSIRTEVLDHKSYPDRQTFDDAIHELLVQNQIQVICLAGFMRILSPSFVEKWPERILNIHPSLLPSFKGLDVHQRAIDAGARFSGCTVHFVEAGLDDGPIIVQAAVPIAQHDTADRLAKRIIVEEHKIYPMALRWLASGQLRVEGRRVTLESEHDLPESVIAPC